MKPATASSRFRAPAPPIARANSAARSGSNCCTRAPPGSSSAIGRSDACRLEPLARKFGSPLPLWERSDRIVRCDPGEGLQQRQSPSEPLTPTLSHSKSDISDFDNLRCPTRVNPSWGGRGSRLPLPDDLIAPRLTPIPPHPLDHLLDMRDRGFRQDAVAEVEDQ